METLGDAGEILGRITGWWARSPASWERRRTPWGGSRARWVRRRPYRPVREIALKSDEVLGCFLTGESRLQS